MVLIVFVFGKQSIFNKKAQKEFIEMIPLCVIANISFVGTAYLSIVLLNTIEFSSIFGGLMMILVLFVFTYKKWLTPKTDFRLTPKTKTDAKDNLSLIRAATPYAVIIILLLLSRLEVLPFKALFTGFKLGFTNILDTGISVSIAPLYLPGFFFALALLICLPVLKLSLKQFGSEAIQTTKKLSLTAVTLVSAIVLVRLFLNSHINYDQTLAMPLVIANSMTAWFPDSWVFISPFIGALGSFISGSATFSNMMFSQLQFSGAQQLSLEPSFMLILQVIGANAGNMICVVNVVAAASVVGCQGQEGKIIKSTFTPMVIYCLVASMLVSVIFL